MKLGICKLCLKRRELQNSHLLGKAIYRQMRLDEGEDPITMTRQLVFQTSRQLTDYLLCTTCEDQFNKGGEAYVSGLVWRSKYGFPLLDRIMLSHYDRKEGYLEAYGTHVKIDTDKLAYYGMSLIWRAGVHRWPTVGGQIVSIENISAADLDSMRKYLLRETSLPPNMAVIITAASDLATQTHFLAPTGATIQVPYKDYVVLVMGIRFNVVITHPGLPLSFSNICCVRSPQKSIFVRNLERETVEMVRPFHTEAKVARNVRKPPRKALKPAFPKPRSR